jgi:hypothetical protein
MMAGELLARAITAAPLSPRPVECETEEFLALPKVWRAIKLLGKKNFTVELIAILVEALLNERLHRRGLKPTKVSPTRLRRVLRRQACLKKDAEACRWLNIKLQANGAAAKDPAPEMPFYHGMALAAPLNLKVTHRRNSENETHLPTSFPALHQ